MRSRSLVTLPLLSPPRAAAKRAELAPDAEVGGHEGDVVAFEVARSRRDPERRYADLAPGRAEQHLPVRRAVHPHAHDDSRVEALRREGQGLADAPRAVATLRIVALDALPERGAVAGLV